MYHGKKRPIETKKLSEEEQKQQEELANKITKMLDEFLEIRHDKKKVQEPLEFCNIMVELCPEIPHVYNFRRELLLKLFENKLKNELEQQYQLVCKEIMMTMVLLKKRPKCYAIWSHRQWLVLKAYEIEELIEKETGEKKKPRMVEQDLQICSKMLQMDERNFHAWNYRIWLVRDVLKYNPKLIEKELEYLKQKIEDNFSNFSAFHFRTKHFTVQHQQKLEDGETENKQEIIQNFLSKEVYDEELEMVKNAIFIQPNEQGVWQYYRWLLSLQIPYQIISAKIKKIEGQKIDIVLTASQSVSNFSENIKFKNQENQEIDSLKIVSLVAQRPQQDNNQPQTQNQNQEFSYIWLLQVENSGDFLGEFTLEIQENSCENSQKRLCQEQQLQKHNFLSSEFKVKLEKEIKNSKIYFLKKENQNQKKWEKIYTLIEQENEFLQEVIESEPNNTFSQHHLIFVQLTCIYLDFLKNFAKIGEKSVQKIEVALGAVEKLSVIAKRQIKFLEVQKEKLNYMKSLFLNGKCPAKNFNFETLNLTPYIAAFGNLYE
ncbi:hypothetical protein PPERSA_02664 [Pseudocohnilembus persalinus]|uniref:Geranylgeranyl transferase type-2 subunit alpha n=1 Tax=Pseudocohnilembus persalinus TaxID=266149 RepID=A0A0V0R605_PSEPJ|nr:hypothetical protein PPERSA_02664 [Pseudocohnilembus persalinus]|eukprot:KRX09792.1 hypothetical protein PPERSA_02664 [Pseudocohnilembus persalinus]